MKYVESRSDLETDLLEHGHFFHFRTDEISFQILDAKWQILKVVCIVRFFAQQGIFQILLTFLSYLHAILFIYSASIHVFVFYIL